MDIRLLRHQSQLKPLEATDITFKNADWMTTGNFLIILQKSEEPQKFKVAKVFPLVSVEEIQIINEQK